MSELNSYESHCDEGCMRVLNTAFEESRSRGQYYVSVDHVIKALARDEPYLFHAALSDLNYDPSVVTASLETRLEKGLRLAGNEIKIGPDVTDLLKRSMEQAKSHKREKIEAVDLLKVMSEMGLFSLYVTSETNEQVSDSTLRVLPPSRVGFRGYLVCLALIGLVFMGQCGVARLIGNRFRRINRAVLNPSFSSPQVNVQPLDPLLDASQKAAERNDFNFGDKASSETVLSLRQKQFRAQETIASKNYSSLFSFLQQLQFEGRLDDEYSTLETWLKGSAFDRPVRWPSQRYYLGYIDYFYVEPTRGCLDAGQFARAKWLSHEAARRIFLMDTHSSPDEYVRAGVNIVLLYEALFWKPEFVYQNLPTIKVLDEIVHSNFDKSMRDRLNNLRTGDETESYKHYWLGVYEFRDGNFGKAEEEFQNASITDSNPMLKDLSFLMKARCIFWSQRALLKIQAGGPSRVAIIANAKSAIGELRAIQSTLVNSNFRDDIARYIDELERLNS
jgi:hypothetical protein